MSHPSFDGNSLGLRINGRAKKPLTYNITGELDHVDLSSLDTEKGVAPIDLKKLRERHHMLARTLASGTPEGEAAIMCNYDPSRVSILKRSPAFRELLKFYQLDTDRQYLDMHARLAGVSMDALDELSLRLEDSPDEISVGQLIEVAKMGADRTGHGPSTTTNVDVKIGLASRLASAAERRKLALDSSGIIDAEVIPE